MKLHKLKTDNPVKHHARRLHGFVDASFSVIYVQISQTSALLNNSLLQISDIFVYCYCSNYDIFSATIISKIKRNDQ